MISPVVKCRVPHETHAGTCWQTFPGRIPSIEQTSWHFFFAMSSSSSSRSFSVKHRSRTRRVLGESSKAQTISIRGMSKICSLALLPKIFFVQGSSSFNLEGWRRRRDEERTSLEIDPPLWSWRKFILLSFVSRLWASIVSSDASPRFCTATCHQSSSLWRINQDSNHSLALCLLLPRLDSEWAFNSRTLGKLDRQLKWGFMIEF